MLTAVLIEENEVKTMGQPAENLDSNLTDNMGQQDAEGFGKKLEIKSPSKNGDRNGQSFSKLFMNPILNLKQEKAFSPLLVGLILALIGTGTLGFFFIHEFQLRKQTISKLVQVESERSSLEQSVAQLRKEVAKQREELEKLAGDLKEANTKAAMVDTLQTAHQVELDRVTKLYDNQLSSLKQVLEVREGLIQTFESNLVSIRRLLERNSQAASAPNVAVGMPLASVNANNNEASKKSVQTSISPAGKVVAINQANRFILLSYGPTEGAQMGQYIQIHHGGKFLGQGRIERVYQTLSAATILSDDTLRQVEVGDPVFLTFS
jgi:hypothetical protein